MSKQRKARIRGLIFLIIGIAVLAGALIFLQLRENSQYRETRNQMTAGFGTLKVVDFDGVQYREKPAITTILIAGIDPQDGNFTDTKYAYRGGGPADFLMLLAIDHNDKVIHRLQIDRDTMVDVDVVGIFGNDVGTRNMQITLSHNYGKDPQDNAQHTVTALRRLLGGVEIDGYYMIEYPSMALINDTIGPVTVHLDYDMTSVNPEWTQGKDIELHGQEAEQFVRSRKTVGEGTNVERMDRQNEYMNKAIQLIKKRLSENLGFGEELLSTLQNEAVTNFTQKRLLEELNQCYNFEIGPIYHPAGTHFVNQFNNNEFHMEENAAVEWVLEHLYTKVE